jgi:tRNA(fMet)-specific endonuclease VapC
MDEALLDTDILSEILKGKNRHVLDEAGRYLGRHQRFSFSAITHYEIVRGFRANRAATALAKFLELAQSSDVVPVSIAILNRAADLWAEARRLGRPRNDADLIIAATALDAKRMLVTGNADHFAWVPGLSLANWRSA